MILTMVPMHLVPLAWPEVEPWIVGACDRVSGDITVHGLKSLCAHGDAGLILIAPSQQEAPVAAGVRQIREHQNGTRSCWVLAVGGERAAPWSAVMQVIEADARAKNCAVIEFVGRPGWARLLPDFECQREGSRAEYRKRLV